MYDKKANDDIKLDQSHHHWICLTSLKHSMHEIFTKYVPETVPFSHQETLMLNYADYPIRNVDKPDAIPNFLSSRHVVCRKFSRSFWSRGKLNSLLSPGKLNSLLSLLLGGAAVRGSRAAVHVYRGAQNFL